MLTNYILVLYLTCSTERGAGPFHVLKRFMGVSSFYWSCQEKSFARMFTCVQRRTLSQYWGAKYRSEGHESSQVQISWDMRGLLALSITSPVFRRPRAWAVVAVIRDAAPSYAQYHRQSLPESLWFAAFYSLLVDDDGIIRTSRPPTTPSLQYDYRNIFTPHFESPPKKVQKQGPYQRGRETVLSKDRF